MYKKKKFLLRNTIILILFFIWIPYFIIVLFKGNAGVENTKEVQTVIETPESYVAKKSIYYVICEDNRGKSYIGLEEYLTGILATTIDVNYEIETLKAQAVLLRSTILYEMNKKGVSEMEEEAFGFTYLNDIAWKKVWGSDFGANMEKCKKAVQETEGIIICYKGENIPGTFCAISASGTRKGEGEGYPYLAAVECPKSVEAKDYLNLYTFAKSTWGSIEITKTDESGYVTELCVNGETVSGEAFKEEYDLASTCMSIHSGSEYVIETRGRGHGFGMDQYYANCLECEGEKNDYMEILNFFYENISFERTASYKK